MSPNSQPHDDDTFHRPGSPDSAALWTSHVVSALPSTEREALPGIVSPLRVCVEFASNSHDDSVSITMGNGRVRLSGGLRPQSSGPLALRLDWSTGFRAHGITVGDELGDWTVLRADGRGMLLHGSALGPEKRETALPTVSVVKTDGASSDDEFTARVWGEAADYRGATIRGWSRM